MRGDPPSSFGTTSRGAGEGTPTDGFRASTGRTPAAGAHAEQARRTGPRNGGRGRVRPPWCVVRAPIYPLGRPPARTPLGRTAPGRPLSRAHAADPAATGRPPTPRRSVRPLPHRSGGRGYGGQSPMRSPGTSVIPVSWPNRPHTRLHRPRPRGLNTARLEESERAPAHRGTGSAGRRAGSPGVYRGSHPRSSARDTSSTTGRAS